MKLLNLSLLKKVALLCCLLFVLNCILMSVKKKDGFYIETVVDGNTSKLSEIVKKQKEKSCSNCKESSSSKHVNTKCGPACD